MQDRHDPIHGGLHLRGDEKVQSMPQKPPGILDPETVIAVIAATVFGGATDLDEGLHRIVRLPCPLPYVFKRQGVNSITWLIRT